MADKEIIIGGKTVMYATSVKASPETSTSSTATFDGAITQGADKVAWNIELSKIKFKINIDTNIISTGDIKQ